MRTQGSNEASPTTARSARRSPPATNKDKVAPKKPRVRQAFIAALATATVVVALSFVGTYAARDALLLRGATTGNVVGAAIAIKLGANVNYRSLQGELPLLASARKGHGQVSKLLLSAGADPNLVDADGRSLLYRAVQDEDLRLVQHLLRWKADPNRVGPHGMTPIGLAIQGGQYPIAAALRAVGADIDKWEGAGKPPLFLAIDANDAAMVDKVLEMGADIHALGPGDIAALPYAITLKRPQVALRLLERGHDANHAGRDGITALAEAVRIGDETLVARLIAARAQVNRPSRDGKPPIQLAAEHGHGAIAARLVHAGCKTAYLDKKLQAAARLMSSWRSADAALAGEEVARHLAEVTSPVVTQYLRIRHPHDAGPIQRAAIALHGYLAAYDAVSAAQSDLAAYELQVEADRERLQALREANPTRTVRLKRRFPFEKYSLVAAYEAYDMTTLKKMVVLAPEGTVDVGVYTLALKYLGEEAVTVRNTTTYQTYLTTEYYKVYEVSPASTDGEAIAARLAQADTGLFRRRDAQAMAEAALHGYGDAFRTLSRALRRWR